MKKWFFAPTLIVLACFIAGCYGALHNQVSYTVAPEYFTKFKFHQFQVGEMFRNREGAALVGWSASWWMGLILSPLILPVSLWKRDLGNAYGVSLKAFLIVLAVAFLTGLIGLLGATVYLDEANAGQFTRYGNVIEDNVAFARAGIMHNCSYLGGALGLIASWFYLGSLRWREARNQLNME